MSSVPEPQTVKTADRDEFENTFHAPSSKKTFSKPQASMILHKIPLGSTALLHLLKEPRHSCQIFVGTSRTRTSRRRPRPKRGSAKAALEQAARKQGELKPLMPLRSFCRPSRPGNKRQADSPHFMFKGMPTGWHWHGHIKGV